MIAEVEGGLSSGVDCRGVTREVGLMELEAWSAEKLFNEL